MVRRDRVPRGAAFSHSGYVYPHYLALGVEDQERIEKPRGDFRLWSVEILPGVDLPATNGLVWCRGTDLCVIHPPDTWSTDTLKEIYETSTRLAKGGVWLTPMCGLLYRYQTNKEDRCDSR